MCVNNNTRFLIISPSGESTAASSSSHSTNRSRLSALSRLILILTRMSQRVRPAGRSERTRLPRRAPTARRDPTHAFIRSGAFSAFARNHHARMKRARALARVRGFVDAHPSVIARAPVVRRKTTKVSTVARVPYWCCYLLTDRTERRTYIGATVDLPHRLRQHNQLIRGGARSTKRSRLWRVAALVHVGAQRNCLSFEWHAKRRARSGALARAEAMRALARERGLRFVDYEVLRAALRSSAPQGI